MISNSSPLICLAKINHLEILKKLFQTIIITEDVKNEVLESEKPGYIEIKKAIKEGWIKIINPLNNIQFRLDSGENSIINLTNERNDTLIIDDNKGIKIALTFNLNVLRTTDIIVMALHEELINKKQAISYIHQIVEQGYYLSSQYYSKILQEIENYQN